MVKSQNHLLRAYDVQAMWNKSTACFYKDKHTVGQDQKR